MSLSRRRRHRRHRRRHRRHRRRRRHHRHHHRHRHRRHHHRRHPELPTLSINDGSVQEDAGSAMFTVRLSKTDHPGVTVEYETSAGTATAGEDYETKRETLAINAGDATGTISIDVLDDEVWEQTETFEVTLRNPTGATIEDGGGVGTGTILDDEEEPTLSIDDVEVDEGAGSAMFTVRLSGRSAEAVTVEYATSDVTALAGEDYETKRETLAINAGDATGTISIDVLDDEVWEQTETFEVTLRNPTGATIEDGGGVGTGTILDDEEEPTLSIDDVEVDEGAGSAMFTVRLSGRSAEAVTVEYATSDVTATAGEDYTTASGTLIFEAQSRTQTISVPILEDTADEGDETFSVTLGSATNTTILEGTGTGTITDNDGVQPPPPPPPPPPPSLPTLSIGDAPVGEGAGNAVFTVTLSETSSDEVTVGYSTSDGTAEAGADYTSKSGTLTFSAGSWTETIEVPVTDDTAVEDAETFTVTLSTPSNATIGIGTGTGTITDNDGVQPSLPTLSIGDAPVGEGAGNAVFTVTLSEASADEVTVAYATEDGTAEAGTDYTSKSGTLTFLAGSRTETIEVPVTDDTAVEDAEAFTVTLSTPSNATILDGTATGTIADNDGGSPPPPPPPPPSLPELSIGDAPVGEGSGSAVFTVTLSAASADEVTVAYATEDGTAEAGTDYTSKSGALTFSAGSRTRTISVPVTDDAAVEDTETFTVTLSTPSGNATIGDGTGTGTITDNDGVQPPSLPELSIGDAPVGEGAGNAVFTVTLSAESAQVVTVDYETADGTAEAGSDYTTTSGKLTFSVGSRTRTILVPVVDDTNDERDETFTVTLSDSVNATILDNTGTGTILDDDGDAPRGRPRLSIGDVDVAENAGRAEFTVTLSHASNRVVTVAYATSNGTARAGQDYTGTRGTLTISAGRRTGTIPVRVLDDEYVERDETFTVTLRNASGATILVGKAKGTILDDDREKPPPPLPTLAIDDVEVSEGAGSAEFTVTLSAPSADDVTVGYATSAGTATAGEDYETKSGTLTIGAGHDTGTISIDVVDDGEEEGSETLTVTLSSPTGATIEDGEGVGTILDDDAAEPPPEMPTLAVDDVEVAEDGGSTAFTVTLSEASGDAVTVGYATSDGTAEAGSDYTAVSETLTIEAGATTGTISVPVLDDEVIEGNETFTVTLSGAVGATIEDGEGLGTILDDDGVEPPPGLPTLSIGDATVDEGGGSAQFTVTLSEASDQTVTVDYETSDGTAEASSDYTTTSGTLTIAPNTTTGTISVSVLDDEVVEGDETFTVVLSGASGATIEDGEGLGTITDDDGEEPPPGLPTLSIGDATVAEGGGSAQFTVTLSEASDQTVTVDYETSDGTAEASSDYTTTSGTLTIAPNTTTGTISVSVLDDEVVEGDETFTVVLSGASGATIEDGEGLGTITDDDGEEPPPGLPTLSIGDATVAEGGGSAQFTVTLSEASGAEVTVVYATSDETARASRDYTASSGTLTIAAGSTTGMISVLVLDDEVVEGDETFTVVLSGASGATIVDGEGVGTITDDDHAELTVSYGAASYTVTEGSTVAVTVVLSKPPGTSVTIPLTHMPVGAVASDYSGVPDGVRFDSSETQRSFNVLARKDAERDEGERVILEFGTLPSGIAPADPETSTITIVDQPPPTGRKRNDWLRRFGETAAGHLLEALDERIRCAPIRQPVSGRHESPPPRRGCEPRHDELMSLVVAGHRLPVMRAPSMTSGIRGLADESASAMAPDDWILERRGTRALQSLTAREVLTRSAFQVLSQSEEGAQRLSLWGRGALSHFDDGNGGSALDGDVASAVIGVDYADHRVLAGIAFSHSEGDGSFLHDGLDREPVASLTGLYPYAYVGVNERVSVWGAVGLGSGTLKLTNDDLESETDIGARMGAAGARREILYPADNWGVSLALKADALLLQIDSDESLDLDATRNMVSRQRLALELSQEFTLGTGEWIAPFVEVGARRDGGDAETALGAEVSGGFRYEHPVLGLTAEFDVRGLLLHSGDDVEEMGVSGSLRYDPMTHSNLGPNLALSLSGGPEGWTDSDALWGHGAPGGWVADDGDAPGMRIDAEFGYGVPVLNGFGTGTPWIGTSLSDRWRDLHLGYRLGLGSDVNLGIDGRLRESAAGDEPSDYAIMLRLSVR